MEIQNKYVCVGCGQVSYLPTQSKRTSTFAVRCDACAEAWNAEKTKLREESKGVPKRN